VSLSGAKVVFTAATTININGCFSADYDNYLIVVRHKMASAPADGLNFRLRVSGSDASGSNYTAQRLLAASTTVSGIRYSSVTSGAVGFSTAYENGDHLYLYGPYLAQPTAARNVSAAGTDYASIYDYATTHSLSTSYDGITIFPLASTITGALTIYGLSQ
jgi:hypothetical protein